MWRIWMIFDPRRALVGVLVFAFLMVMVNHFVQLSTPRYGSWLNEAPPGTTASVQQESDAVMVADADQ